MYKRKSLLESLFSMSNEVPSKYTEEKVPLISDLKATYTFNLQQLLLSTHDRSCTKQNNKSWQQNLLLCYFENICHFQMTYQLFTQRTLESKARAVDGIWLYGDLRGSLKLNWLNTQSRPILCFTLSFNDVFHHCRQNTLRGSVRPQPPEKA